MRTLAVYWSMSGAVRRFAEKAASITDADMEELVDHGQYRGAGGFFTRLGKAAKRNVTEIDPTKHDPTTYDRVIICTPLWGDTLAPALRTYLLDNKDRLGHVTLIYVGGFSEGKAARKEVTELGFVLDASLGFIVKNNVDEVLPQAEQQMEKAFATT